MTEDLTNKVVAWASEVAGYAAQLPSRQARDDYLRERRRELVTGAQAEGARATSFGIGLKAANWHERDLNGDGTYLIKRR